MGFDFEGCEIDKDYWEAQEARYKHISHKVTCSAKKKCKKQSTKTRNLAYLTLLNNVL